MSLQNGQKYRTRIAPYTQTPWHGDAKVLAQKVAFNTPVYLIETDEYIGLATEPFTPMLTPHDEIVLLYSTMVFLKAEYQDVHALYKTLGFGEHMEVANAG